MRLSVRTYKMLFEIVLKIAMYKFNIETITNLSFSYDKNYLSLWQTQNREKLTRYNLTKKKSFINGRLTKD